MADLKLPLTPDEAHAVCLRALGEHSLRRSWTVEDSSPSHITGIGRWYSVEFGFTLFFEGLSDDLVGVSINTEFHVPNAVEKLYESIQSYADEIVKDTSKESGV